MTEEMTTKQEESFWSGPLSVGAVFAAAILTLHFLFNSGYGYFRDELYFMACAEHLAWGYPDHAPMVAFMAKTSRVLMGDSLFSIRFFPAVAAAVKVMLTAMLVKEFGGKRFAAIIACVCVFFAPVYLAIDNLLSMNSLEPVFWTLCVYFSVLAIKREDSRWWLLFGLFAGLGLMNKHSMIFFGAAMVVGLLLTEKRRVFLDKYFWAGGVIALLIFLPNIIWEYRNDFATLELLRNVQTLGKNVVMTPFGFFVSQIMTLLPLSFPVWIAGLWYLLFDRNDKRFRYLGIAYIVVFAIMILLKGKDYYLVPIYPMLFAAGGVFWASLSERFRAVQYLAYAELCLLVVLGLLVMPTVVPILPVETLIAYQNAIGFKPPRSEVLQTSPLQQIFGDQLIWDELVTKTADVYNGLPVEERGQAAIYASNYGEAGAIDLFGPKYGLPKAISPHQSYFLWGPRDYTGEIVILLGARKEEVEKNCESVEEKTRVDSPYSDNYEKFNILICRHTNQPLPEVWPKLKFWN
ncbi:MAG: glycosyltransferase family 39 protein [Acidobacteriota bacterium]